MKLDKGYVRIFEGEERRFYPSDEGRLVAAIYLDRGQSVREIKEPETSGPKKKSKRGE